MSENKEIDALRQELWRTQHELTAVRAVLTDIVSKLTKLPPAEVRSQIDEAVEKLRPVVAPPEWPFAGPTPPRPTE